MSYYEIKSDNYPNMRWRVENTKNKNVSVTKYIDGGEEPKTIEHKGEQAKIVFGVTEALGDWKSGEALVSASVKNLAETCNEFRKKLADTDPEFNNLFEARNGRLRINAKVEQHFDSIKEKQKLVDRSKTLLLEYKRSICNTSCSIDPLLLADIRSETGEIIDLYTEIINNDNQKIYIYAEGGAGKTYTLVNLSDYILSKNVGIVPILIPVKYLLADGYSPILDYLCLKYANIFSEYDRTIDKSKILIRLNSYLANTNQKIVIILDGINEEQEECIKDINKLGVLERCSIIVTSRNTTNSLSNLNWEGYKILSLQGLSAEKIRLYIASKNVDIPTDFIYDQSVLASPMFLRMFVESMRAGVKIAGGCSQANIMDAWINKQLMVINNGEFNSVMSLFLPVFTLMLYEKVGQRISLTIDDKKESINKALKILNDKDVRTNIAAYGYDVLDNIISLHEAYRYFNLIVCNKLAILQQTENGEIYWRHEHFRDFFVAKGLKILIKYSNEKFFKEHISKFMNIFKYPEVFEKNNYSALVISLYFTELVKDVLGDEVSKNIYIYNMIRNIIYYSDDLGFSDKVVQYANYELMVDEISSDFNQFDIANTFNGVACTLLKIQDISMKNDGNQIANRAERLLEKSDEMLKKIYPNVYELNINHISDIDKMSPDYLIKYYSKKSESILSRLDIKSENNKKYLELYSRICGNKGLLYLTKHHLYMNNNQDIYLKESCYLAKAENSHAVGALFKYCLYDYSCSNETDKEIEKAKDRFDISLLALGTDAYHAKKFKRSINFYNLAIQWVAKESTKPRTLSYLVRSKVADYSINSENYSQQDLIDIINMEKEALCLYAKFKMKMQIERVANITKTFIDAYREYGVNGYKNEKIDAELRELARDIDRKYFELYITTSSLPEVEKYLLR